MPALPTRRRYKFTNAPVITTLASGMTSSDTTFSIVTATNWPAASGSENFWVTIGAGTTTEERILCSGSSGTTVTVASSGRGQDGTAATAHNQGDSVWVSWSATDADEANAHVSASASSASVNVHGLSTGSSVVGTTDTQTLTNKTFTDPRVSGASGGSTLISGATGTASNTVTLPAVTGTLVTTGDSGTVTSTMIANGTIVDADVNASAAIAATKISGTAVTQTDTGTVTSTMILDGTIMNADINASAAIAATKIADGSVSNTEFQYLDGVTSAIQTQLNAKAATGSSNTFTNLQTLSQVEPIVNNTTATGTVTLDVSTGTTFTLTVTGIGVILAFTNLPTAGSTTLTLVLTQGSGGSKTIAWASTTINGTTVAPKWAGGSAPSLSTTANQIDVVTLVVNRTSAPSTTVFGFLAGKNFT